MEDGLGDVEFKDNIQSLKIVLILVLVEDGLGETSDVLEQLVQLVLILVLVEDGLGERIVVIESLKEKESLNPCFGGRWSRRL